jgi:hypothetical protein
MPNSGYNLDALNYNVRLWYGTLYR